MMTNREQDERYDRVARYLSVRQGGVKLKEYLGGGTDGDVWKSDADTAVKAFHRKISYFNEKEVYERLAYWGIVQQIDGFWIPEMLGHDDELMVIEMDLMPDPPYIIDFAKVHFDFPPDFPEDKLEEAEREGRERFEHHWDEVKSLLATLASYGIYYTDPNRGNITFPDMK